MKHHGGRETGDEIQEHKLTGEHPRRPENDKGLSSAVRYHKGLWKSGTKRLLSRLLGNGEIIVRKICISGDLSPGARVTQPECALFFDDLFDADVFVFDFVHRLVFGGLIENNEEKVSDDNKH